MEIENFSNYLIYPDGKVFSKKSNKFLKPYDTGRGYLSVELGGKNHKVHRLVAIHYIPNPENKPEVDHINRNTSDNHIENLRWMTSKENNNNRSGEYKIKTIRKTSTGFMWITKNAKSNMFRRTNCKCKSSQNLSKLLCYSFFYLLKHPL